MNHYCNVRDTIPLLQLLFFVFVCCVHSWQHGTICKLFVFRVCIATRRIPHYLVDLAIIRQESQHLDMIILRFWDVINTCEHSAVRTAPMADGLGNDCIPIFFKYIWSTVGIAIFEIFIDKFFILMLGLKPGNTPSAGGRSSSSRNANIFVWKIKLDGTIKRIE